MIVDIIFDRDEFKQTKCHSMDCLILFSIPLADVGEFGKHFEGDIVLDGKGRNGITNTRLLWPHATLIFYINDNFSPQEKQLIIQSMQILTEVSCIRFKQRTNENAYVYFSVSLSFKRFLSIKIVLKTK